MVPVSSWTYSQLLKNMYCACSSLHRHCPGTLLYAVRSTEPLPSLGLAGRLLRQVVDLVDLIDLLLLALCFAPGAFRRLSAAGVDSTLNFFKDSITDGKGFIPAAMGFLACS